MRLLEFVLHHVYHERYFPLDMDYFREAITQYAQIDARGKVVIDVGADYGCTPLVWAAQGARKIIAFERVPARRERMKRFLGREPWLEIRGAWDGDTPEGDVLQTDKVGGEEGIDAQEMLKHYTQVLIVRHVFEPEFKEHGYEEWTEFLSR